MQEHLQTPSEVQSIHPGLAQVAAALKTHRKRLGLTQIQVADKLGISQSFLSKLENAKAEPSALQWLHFCELTQIDPRCVLPSKQTMVEPMRTESRAEAPRPAMMAKPA